MKKPYEPGVDHEYLALGEMNNFEKKAWVVLVILLCLAVFGIAYFK